jgi:hypothetical protein
VPQANTLTHAVGTIRSASEQIEGTFLKTGQALESSIEILALLAERFELVLTELNGENLGTALNALSRTSAMVDPPGQPRSKVSVSFHRLLGHSEAIADRIAQMTDSLKDVDVLAINARIAAAHIHAPGVDFSSFADEIARTLKIARQGLENFSAELRNVRQHLVAAHLGQLAFESHKMASANSITDRLAATVEAVTRHIQHATKATAAVRQRSTGVRQRICDAILALQIGDVTRQRLEHMDFSLGLLPANQDPRKPRNEDLPSLDYNEQCTFTILTHRLQSAQCWDATRNFHRDVTKISESLSSLAREARAMWALGGAAYGAADRGGSTVIATLEGQIGEALGLFERFGVARVEVVNVTTTVLAATGNLCGHLQKVQSLEADIRIMGLNTTFKCARIGQTGAALNIIAQELRAYAHGFAKEVDALVRDVNTISTVTGSLASEQQSDEAAIIAAGIGEIKESMSTMRQVGQVLDDALAELERDGGRVVTLLEDTVRDLGTCDETGRALRETAEILFETSPDGFLKVAELTRATEQMVASIERGYTMATERAIHDKFLRRSADRTPDPVTAKPPEVDDFLF